MDRIINILKQLQEHKDAIKELEDALTYTDIVKVICDIPINDLIEDREFKLYKEWGIFHKKGKTYIKHTGSKLLSLNKEKLEMLPLRWSRCPLNPNTTRPYYVIDMAQIVGSLNNY